MNILTILEKECPLCQCGIKIIKERPVNALTCPSCWEIIEMDKEDYEQEI